LPASSHNSVKLNTRSIARVHAVTVAALTSLSHWIRDANFAPWNWHHLLMRQTPCYSEQTVILRDTCGTRGMGELVTWRQLMAPPCLWQNLLVLKNLWFF